MMELEGTFRRLTIVIVTLFLLTSLAAVLDANTTPSPPARTGESILINKATNRLYFYRDGRLVKEYPVATGRSPELTPEGSFTILTKGVDTPGANSMDPRLGTRWMGLSAGGARAGYKYGIHGTNDPSSIGKYASGGCIRMHNEDAEELFRMVPTGTPVEIRRAIGPVQSMLFEINQRN